MRTVSSCCGASSQSHFPPCSFLSWVLIPDRILLWLLPAGEAFTFVPVVLVHAVRLNLARLQGVWQGCFYVENAYFWIWNPKFTDWIFPSVVCLSCANADEISHSRQDRTCLAQLWAWVGLHLCLVHLWCFSGKWPVTLSPREGHGLGGHGLVSSLTHLWVEQTPNHSNEKGLCVVMNF